MGVYRWYVIFSLILFSALSYASVPFVSDKPTSQQCLARPELTSTTMTHSWQVGSSYYAYYQGCEYVDSMSTSSFICMTIGTDGYYCNWKTTGKVETSDDSGDTGDSGDSGGGSTEPSYPDITPPVKPPVKPDTSSVGQLFELYSNCTSDLGKFPLSNYDDYNPAIDYNYNARAKQCNSIYDNMSSLVTTNSMSSPSDDNHQFITKDGSGSLYHCKRNPYTPQEMADMGKLYPGEILGNQILKAHEREIGYDCQIVHDSSDGKDKNRCNFHLNFNYGTDNGKGTTVCNSVYNVHQDSGDSDSGTAPHQCPSGQFYDPGMNACFDTSAVQCDAGYHPVFTGPDAPSCQPDTGSSGGNTDSDDDSGPGLSTPSLDVPELTLSPLWNIWPSARDFKLSLPVAQCPVFNIEVFGTNHKIDTFCTLFTPDIIAIIRAICILTASIISFIIVLRS
ncbi:hypothetical protein HBD75_000450 [Salmonella enterica]|nr:hypothetical protein [Salmonella enterica]EEU4802855.1 hypothetical protein [Salmonella enterica]EEU4865967.1 hypothetical protein [Salmonella enterica]EEU4893578.1 hypothetical protein [Salmonella enterica]